MSVCVCGGGGGWRGGQQQQQQKFTQTVISLDRPVKKAPSRRTEIRRSRTNLQNIHEVFKYQSYSMTMILNNKQK